MAFLFFAGFIKAQDPSLDWAEHMGGANTDCIGESIALDGYGNVYIA